ncbi:MAG TPA: hypothetical protein VMW72_14265 [Sedimentisphaerales bacterium]|nr:hypothetical protein [Sedimentisphaerales bacterium]
MGLLTEKTARRDKGTPPQHGSQSTQCLSADVLRQRQIAAGRVAKAQRKIKRQKNLGISMLNRAAAITNLKSFRKGVAV